MQNLFDILFVRTWWSYEQDHGLLFSPYYRGFNLLEGCAWLVLAGLVIVRYARCRNSRLEIWYSAMFFTFGLSDFLEARFLSSWLIWLKLINLIILLYLRHIVIRRFYPASKLY